MAVPLLLGGIALLAAVLGRAPDPQDFTPRGYIQVEVVSVRMAPTSGRGEIRGYLGLRSVVPDTPEHPVEAHEALSTVA